MLRRSRSPSISVTLSGSFEEATVTRKNLLLTLFLLALSGFMLHYRVHNFMVPDKLHPGTFLFNRSLFLASLFPLIDVVVVTLLFMWKKTAVYGYLLNGFIVIYGTVFMAHFSFASFDALHIPPSDWIIKSTLPDIGIAWADFFVGKALYDLYMGKVTRP
jgi:hypothetical protein